MQAGIYEPLVLEVEDGRLLAYAWQVLLPGRRSALLDYFAVRSDLRGRRHRYPGRSTRWRTTTGTGWTI